MHPRALPLLLISSFFCLSGFGEKHSAIEVQSLPQGQGLELRFVVKPDAGMQISKEAPWTLQLRETQGLKLNLKDGRFESKDFNEELPGFSVKTDMEAGVTQGKLEYVLKAFVCTIDKKHCYPQQHKGSFVWKKA